MTSPAPPDVDALCDDCPPVGYETDRTRCLPCPRRATPASGEAAEGAQTQIKLQTPPDEKPACMERAKEAGGQSLVGLTPASALSPKPAPDAVREAETKSNALLVADRIAAYFNDGPPNDGSHSDAAGGNAFELLLWAEEELRYVAAQIASAPVPSPDGTLAPCETINASSILAAMSSGQATATKSNSSSIAPVTEMPESVRIPLHSLQADLRYLIGRVIADGSCGPVIVQSMRERLDQIETALSPSDAGAAEPVAWQHRVRPTAREAWSPWQDGKAAPTGWQFEDRPLYAAPPVRGDREALAKLQEIVDLDSHGRYGRLAREAIGLLSLPVQPGAGERDVIDRLRELYTWCCTCNDFRQDSRLSRRVAALLSRQPAPSTDGDSHG